MSSDLNLSFHGYDIKHKIMDGQLWICVGTESIVDDNNNTNNNLPINEEDINMSNGGEDIQVDENNFTFTKQGNNNNNNKVKVICSECGEQYPTTDTHVVIPDKFVYCVKNCFPTVPYRVYLWVPFEFRHKAKTQGAKWDREKKLWYCSVQNTNLQEMFDVKFVDCLQMY